MLLAGYFSPEQTRLIPHPRVATLTETIRGLPAEQIRNGDRRFALPGPQETLKLTRTGQIPLPDGTPPIARIDPDIPGHPA